MNVQDERIDRAIGIILRTGVLCAALLVTAGGIGYFASRSGPPPSYQTFHGAPPELTHFMPIVRGAASLRPLFIMQLGLVLLIATPVIRVVACAVGFTLERDWRYAIVSALVLALLMCALFVKPH